jgi:hypothetical protein
MGNRSTRLKLRNQCTEAKHDLYDAEEHLIKLAALADSNSKYIEDNLPEIILALECCRDALLRFEEGL